MLHTGVIKARYPSVEAMLAALKPSYPVYCLRPARLRAEAQRFLRLFPGKVLYAVKCNPHPSVLRALHDGGIRDFDTASLPEIAQVHELFADVATYFHHPVKSRAAIQTAHEVYGATFFSVDHPDELAKIRQETRGAPITAMVRIKTPTAQASYDMSTKFGATPEMAAMLLRQAHAAGLGTGLSFHVGSQCRRPQAYGAALDLAAETLNLARTPIAWLNVGGGFPANYAHQQLPPLEVFMDEIKTALARHDIFRPAALMCEPGRALVAEGSSLAVQVLLRKDRLIYINDGIFGSLSEMIYDAEFHPPARLIRGRDRAPGAAASMTEFTLFGPTCDPNDRLPKLFRLPEDVREGDWLEISQLGAYSNALQSNFNGFSADTYVEVED